MRQKINKQLRNLTIYLVKKSFSIHQNWPSFLNDQGIIVWDNYKNLSFVLKDEPYEVIYEQCRLNQDYNFLLLDGAIIQMKYMFDFSDNLKGHILTFYPHFDLVKYQDIPEEYEDTFYGNTLFTEICDGKTIPFPLRFDYSTKHTELIHPKVHATFGNYSDCRIPVNRPITPIKFVLFILRNFYYQKYLGTSIENDLTDDLQFDELITEEERKLIHFCHN